METSPSAVDPTELEAVQQELAFLSPDRLTELREDSQETLINAMSEAAKIAGGGESFPSPHAIVEAAEAKETEVRDKIDGEYRIWLDSHMNRDDDPERYNRALAMLRSTSINNMNDAEWHLGEADEDGNHTKPETSGWARAQAWFDEITQEVTAERHVDNTEPVEPDSPTLPNPEQQALDEAQERLRQARDHLAMLSVEMRSKIGTFNKARNSNRRLEEQYEAAKLAYTAAYNDLGVSSVKMLRAAKKTTEEINKEIINETGEERRNFADAEAKVLEQDDSRKRKLARWFGSKPRLLALSAGVGLAAGVATKAAGLLPGIGTAAAVGIKSTRGVLTATFGIKTSQYTQQDFKGWVDIADLRHDIFAEINSTDSSRNTEALARLSTNNLLASIDGRIEKDQKSNRNRVIGAIAIGGASTAAGVWAASHLFHVGGGASHEAAMQHSTATSRPQGSLNQGIVQDLHHNANFRADHPEMFNGYSDWAKTMRVSQPNLPMANGGIVDVHVNPNAYDARLNQLWTQFHENNLLALKSKTAA